MLSIQKAGCDILSGNPGKFYVFVGSEIGVKDRYLYAIQKHYGQVVTFDSVEAALSSMHRREIVPSPPKLYVVRYDDSYIQSLGDRSADEIRNTQIRGTLVCIYSNPKYIEKLDKYIGDYVVNFEPVSSAFVKKYLVSDFPDVDSGIIDFAVNSNTNYLNSYTIVNSLMYASDAPILRYGESYVSDVFGIKIGVHDKLIRYGFASRNAAYTLAVLDEVQVDLNSVFYIFLSTLLDIEKSLTTRSTKSDLRKYLSSWSVDDVYRMFMCVYRELELSRTLQFYDVRDRLIYLLCILQYSPIPDAEVLNGFP